MNILDDIKAIKKLDKSNMLGSIDLLHQQVAQAWRETKGIKLPASYRKINKVVINGMGGSGLGAHIIQSLYFNELKIPLANIHSYDLPGIVDKNTLYIISSYSGETEEPLAAFSQAKKKGAKILGITTGKKLGELISSGKVIGYLFSPKYNICDQPRIGIGYLVAGLLGLLRQFRVIQISDQEIFRAVLFLKKKKKRFGVKNVLRSNIAKQVALAIKNKIPVVVVADFLAGNAHLMANQINENAKNFSNYSIIPEMNHHLMEGLANPKINGKNLKFIFIESVFYNKKNQERIEITKRVLSKNKVGYVSCRLAGKTKLEQSFEMLSFGSYVSFYLAMLNNINPAPVPWVDYFKKELTRAPLINKT